MTEPTLFDEFFRQADAENEAWLAECQAEAEQKRQEEQEEVRQKLAAGFALLGEAGPPLQAALTNTEKVSGMFPFYRATGEIDGYEMSMTVRAGHTLTVALHNQHKAWGPFGALIPATLASLAEFLRDHIARAKAIQWQQETIRRENISSREKDLADYAANTRYDSYWEAQIENYERALPGSREMFAAVEPQRRARQDAARRRKQLAEATRSALAEEEEFFRKERNRIMEENARAVDEYARLAPSCQPMDVWQLSYSIIDEGYELGVHFSLDEFPDKDGYFRVIAGAGEILKRHYPRLAHITYRPDCPLMEMPRHSRFIAGRQIIFRPTLTTQEVKGLVAEIEAVLAPLPEFQGEGVMRWMRAWASAHAAEYGLTEDDVEQIDDIVF